MKNRVYREMMINSFVKEQVKNYVEEGWPVDSMDPTFRGNHIIKPLEAILDITDEETTKVIDFIDKLLNI